MKDKLNAGLRSVLESLSRGDDGAQSLDEIKQWLIDNKSEPHPSAISEIPYQKPVNVEVISVEGFVDDSDVSLRIYTPVLNPMDAALPALVWIHGGGFFGGSAEADDPTCRRFAAECECIVVSVDYRLAPEHSFPEPLHDCIAALKWVASGVHPRIDVTRVGIGGASAGGCLAASLALWNRDFDCLTARFQLLVIPILDDRHITPSSFEICEGPLWNRKLSQVAWQSYLGEYEGELSRYAVPARSVSLADLPQTFISIEQLDIARDEAIDYAQRLMSDGVASELHIYPNTFHGSFQFLCSETSFQHFADVFRFIRYRFSGQDRTTGVPRSWPS